MTGRLVHRRDALAGGMTTGELDELFRQGRWTRLFPQVYWTVPMPTDPAPLARLRIRAAHLWAGGGVVGGSAAACWHGWLTALPAVVELHIPHDRRLSTQPGIRLRRTALSPLDITEHEGITTTTAERTALDLAAVGCTDLLDTMLRKRWYDADAVAAALARGAGQRGWVKARQAVAESVTRPFSVLERDLHRHLRKGGVTGWVANPSLRVASRVVVPDLLFEEQRLVVEIDGHAHHSSREAFENDRMRQNLLVAAGYRGLRFTWRQLVEDPAGVVRLIQAELLRLAA